MLKYSLKINKTREVEIPEQLMEKIERHKLDKKEFIERYIDIKDMVDKDGWEYCTDIILANVFTTQGYNIQWVHECDDSLLLRVVRPSKNME